RARHWSPCTTHDSAPAPHSCPTRRSSDLVQRPARGRDAVDDLLQLLVHVGLLRVPQVEAVGDGQGPGARAHHVTARFGHGQRGSDRKSTRLNSSHVKISYAVFCLKKKHTV